MGTEASDENLKIALSFLNVMETKGIWAAVCAYQCEDFVWWVPGLGEIQQYMETISAIIDAHLNQDGIRFEVRATTSQGDRVAVEAESYATLKSGVKYNNYYHFLFVMRRQRVARLHEYHDSRHTHDVWGSVISSALGGPAEPGKTA